MDRQTPLDPKADFSRLTSTSLELPVEPRWRSQNYQWNRWLETIAIEKPLVGKILRLESPLGGKSKDAKAFWLENINLALVSEPGKIAFRVKGGLGAQFERSFKKRKRP